METKLKISPYRRESLLNFLDEDTGTKTQQTGPLPAQEAAINHSGMHARLLAGPGTGKTYVITRRIVNLVNNERVNPEEILVLTFTRAAAREKVRTRISSMRIQARRLSKLVHCLHKKLL